MFNKHVAFAVSVASCSTRSRTLMSPMHYYTMINLLSLSTIDTRICDEKARFCMKGPQSSPAAILIYHYFFLFFPPYQHTRFGKRPDFQFFRDNCLDIILHTFCASTAMDSATKRGSHSYKPWKQGLFQICFGSWFPTKNVSLYYFLSCDTSILPRARFYLIHYTRHTHFVVQTHPFPLPLVLFFMAFVFYLALFL